MTSPVLTMCVKLIKNIKPFYSALITAVTFSALFSLSACDGNMIFENNKQMKDAVWKSNDIVKYNVDIADKNTLYNFYLNIRINSDYKFANMCLFMKTLYPGGQVSVDTIECFLADVDGRWLGNRSGSIIDNRILLRKNLKFKDSGIHSFEFEQGMRDTALANVEDFGIRIEKAEQ